MVLSRVCFNSITITDTDCIAVVYLVQFVLYFLKVGQFINSKQTNVKQLRCYERLTISMSWLERDVFLPCLFSFFFFLHPGRFESLKLNCRAKIHSSFMLQESFSTPVSSDTLDSFFSFSHMTIIR